MKKSLHILSSRNWNTYQSMQVVHEWEDVFAKELGAELDVTSQIAIDKLYNKPVNQKLQKVVRRSFLKNHVDSSFNYLSKRFPDKLFINFTLYPSPVTNHYSYQKNFINILLDCFADTIDKVPVYFKNNALLFVTNLEVFDYLKNTTIGYKLRYVPLSISDQYYSNAVPIKSIDVLQFGRQNPVLHEWMMQLVANHPQVEYVFAKYENEQYGYYSTTNGYIGSFETRADYMQLLAKTKVALLSSPGIDGGEKRTGGFNPVTPRFYESAANYCYMIARFPDAADFGYNNVASVCERCNSYQDFESSMLHMLSTPFNKMDAYQAFIQQHLSSTVAKTVKQQIDNTIFS